MQGDAERPRHGEHLLHGGADPGALLPHMDGEGDILSPQRRQRTEQFLCGAEALRRVAQPQRHAQRTVGQRLLHGAVDGAVVLVLQTLQLIPGGGRPQGTHAHQHPGVEGQRTQRR